ncbi:tyrosine-type recombinase/integrase [Caulobacter sp. 1776]|uniref:tyrosine-type recombinase/integrase n=1 Tax=Caulobacter sp. 1776 TaxID=3156420 RepID=UPI00339424BB
MAPNKNNPTTRGTSTLMPSVTLDLGRYVTLRPRADGTFRVFFQVPARLRPQGWLSLIPLPVTGTRTGNLQDLDEVARIQADAAALFAKLKGDRRGVQVETRRDMPALVRSWQQTQRFKRTKPATQKGYVYHAGLILAWSESRKHPLVSTMKLDKIEAYLALYDNRPTTRRHVKIVLGMLLDHALALDWIIKNPVDTIKMAAPKSRVRIWEEGDLEFYMFAAAVCGQPGMAALMLTEWEVGQRLSDGLLFRGTWSWKPGTKAAEYDFRGRAFRFWQAKTGSYVTIPVSERLGDMLEETWDPESFYLFRDAATGRPFNGQRASHEFERIRSLAKAAAPAFARHLVLRALRHSCVVQLARSGATVPEIASITGHSVASIEHILSVYLPRDNQVAWNAQAKRGLIPASPDGSRSRSRRGGGAAPAEQVAAELSQEAHVWWARKRALDLVDANDGAQAVASLMSDLGKHPSTAKVVDNAFMLSGMQVAGSADARKIAAWIRQACKQAWAAR